MGFARAGRAVWFVAALVSFLLGTLEVPELYVGFGASVVAIGLALTAGRVTVAWSTGVGLAWVLLYVILAVVRGYQANPSTRLARSSLAISSRRRSGGSPCSSSGAGPEPTEGRPVRERQGVHPAMAPGPARGKGEMGPLTLDTRRSR